MSILLPQTLADELTQRLIDMAEVVSVYPDVFVQRDGADAEIYVSPSSRDDACDVELDAQMTRAGIRATAAVTVRDRRVPVYPSTEKVSLNWVLTKFKKNHPEAYKRLVETVVECGK